MKNSLVTRKQNLKDRILKNRELVLDILSSKIEGAHLCSFLLGQRCIGKACEQFMEFKNIDDTTKKTTSFWRCSFLETPLLIIELNRNIRELIAILASK